ncbi:MAG: glycosyl hydrolase 115 family protein [Butyrivibrio sp.]|nr:glycosyl hydrolase 115 family protein [Butyrivibrio sp.]
MNFTLCQKGTPAVIVLEKSLEKELSKITGIFAEDIRKVSGTKPVITDTLPDNAAAIVIIGIVGKSSLLEGFNREIMEIQGKNESFSVFFKENAFKDGQNALIIAGSDKRGAIYGMFHISEYIGVSAWHFWADAPVKTREEIILNSDVCMVSKQPSVRYRGLFINDEQPCFGNWAKEKYGSIRPGPELYEKIFELILRLKGNYIWPAMWRSDFTLNHIENAELANEMGIIVGASHHEPCCRSGQEFQTLNKTNPQYGREWSFLSNAKGITEFWKDGLIRNKDFENLITIGMRGENDSYLMPENATLEDNINVLKSAITVQKELIAKYAPSVHPQLLAIYKEVEDYFYGDANTPGLKDWDVLKDDIMMLCDDNFANVRTLPDKELLKHPGGFGMYYHFDYFGSPVSYLWINTSPLAKVWEQLTMAYDFGVRSAWIVNVGDIKNQELPLSYFMDLAYDFDKWGTGAINKTVEYTGDFFKKLGFSEDISSKAAKAVTMYTNINAKCRPEPLKSSTYHPVHEHESELMLDYIDEMVALSDSLEAELKGSDLEECFFQLVKYPVMAVAYINCMQIYAGLNAHYAAQGKKRTNVLAELVKKNIDAEKALTKEYHTRNNGKWNHMQSVAHIGYNHWNEERWQYPVCQVYYPVESSRLLVSRTDTCDFTHPNRWNRHVIKLPVCLQTKPFNSVEIANGGENTLAYRVDWDADYLQVGFEDGSILNKNGTLLLEDTTVIKISVLPDKWDGSPDTVVRIYGDNSVELADESQNGYSFPMVEVKVEITNLDLSGIQNNSFIEDNDCISIDASHFAENIPYNDAAYKVIEEFGKTGHGVKVYPQTLSFEDDSQSPSLIYNVFARQTGEYTCDIYTSASNPVVYMGKMQLGVKANTGKTEIVNTIPDHDFIPWKSESWSRGVLDQVHIGKCKLKLNAGANNITLFAKDPAVVIEKIVLWAPDCEIRASYLGPQESFCYLN